MHFLPRRILRVALQNCSIYLLILLMSCISFSQIFPALPSVVYGGSAVLAGCFACFLPETLNVELPDTIDDVEEKW